MFFCFVFELVRPQQGHVLSNRGNGRRNENRPRAVDPVVGIDDDGGQQLAERVATVNLTESATLKRANSTTMEMADSVNVNQIESAQNVNGHIHEEPEEVKDLVVEDDRPLDISSESAKPQNVASTDSMAMDVDMVTTNVVATDVVPSDVVAVDICDDADGQEVVGTNSVNVHDGGSGSAADGEKGCCSCGERGDPKSGTIACTVCNVSYHYECIGLLEEVAGKVQDVYKCAGCRSQDARTAVRVEKRKEPQMETEVAEVIEVTDIAETEPIQPKISRNMLFNGRL